MKLAILLTLLFTCFPAEAIPPATEQISFSADITAGEWKENWQFIEDQVPHGHIY